MADSNERGHRSRAKPSPLLNEPPRPASSTSGPQTAPDPANVALIRHEQEERGVCFVRFVPQPPFDARLVFADRDASRAAAFRQLRQRVLDRGNAHAILCTSAAPSEGKTTLAANLALAFSELGRYRVLLVEANFRPPALGKLFGFVPPKGFRSQILRHRQHPADPWVVVQIGPPPLYIMAIEPNACPRCAAGLPEDAKFCGACGVILAGNGASVLDGAGFSSALERFKQDFDYVIIDAPSVLVGGDVNLIQDGADGVILATRKGYSDERSLRRALDQIAPAPLIGVTLFEE